MRAQMMWSATAIVLTTAFQGAKPNPMCDKRLPPVAFEADAKLKGVTLVGRDPNIGAMGDCNYVVGTKSVALMIQLNAYADHKTFELYTNFGPKAKVEPVGGLGDESYFLENTVGARKGKIFAAATSGSDDHGKVYFSKDQLTAFVRRFIDVK